MGNDVRDRASFVRRNAVRPPSYWSRVIFIDGHSVQKLHLRRVRRGAAAQAVRGQYRPQVRGRLAVDRALSAGRAGGSKRGGSKRGGRGEKGRAGRFCLQIKLRRPLNESVPLTEMTLSG